MYYPMRVVRTKKHKFIWNIAHGLPYPFSSDLWASPTWKSVYKYDLKVFCQRSIEAYHHRPRFELYDLEADPHEVHDLAGQPEYAELVSEFKTKLKAFQEQTDDPWIVKWVYE